MQFAILIGAAALAVLPAPGTAQEPSVQQRFDTASAALDAQRWDDALVILDPLEARLAAGTGTRSLALVRVRKAKALSGLGRPAEAAASLRLALAGLPGSDYASRLDRYEASMMLGDIAANALDYGEAVQSYRSASEVASTPIAKARAFVGLIQTGMFQDATTALSDAEAAVAMAASQAPDDKIMHGMLLTLKGRTLINLRRFAEARSILKRAVDELGGLTREADLADISARSDMAIASLLSGNPTEARQYLAYSGAGTIGTEFARPQQMPAPPCDEEIGRDDVAVIEFSISADGAVQQVAPIYSSKQGATALAFARAVKGWSWTSEDMANIPPVFRRLTRVELRCSTAAERPSVLDILRGDLDAWLTERGIAPPAETEESDAARLKPLLSALAAQDKSGAPDSLSRLPTLLEIADNVALPHAQRGEYLTRALAIARAAKAPGTVIAYLGVKQAAALRYEPLGRPRVPDLSSLYADSAVTSDLRASAALRLIHSDWMRSAGESNSRVLVGLEQVVSLEGLGSSDPIRTAALVRIASIQQDAGNRDAAREAFAKTGLSADQCALLDSQPKLLKSNVSSGDFPREAMRWGFEGWTRIEYDIDAGGNTASIRPIVSYPPFVFGEAGKLVVDDMKFAETFRPDGSPGCGGVMSSIMFKLP